MRKGVITSLDIKEYLEKYDDSEVVSKLSAVSGVSKETVKERIKIYKKINGLLEEKEE